MEISDALLERAVFQLCLRRGILRSLDYVLPRQVYLALPRTASWTPVLLRVRVGGEN